MLEIIDTLRLVFKLMLTWWRSQPIRRHICLGINLKTKLRNVSPGDLNRVYYELYGDVLAAPDWYVISKDGVFYEEDAKEQLQSGSGLQLEFSGRMNVVQVRAWVCNRDPRLSPVQVIRHIKVQLYSAQCHSKDHFSILIQNGTRISSKAAIFGTFLRKSLRNVRLKTLSSQNSRDQ